jgi:hypothetical protein
MDKNDLIGKSAKIFITKDGTNLVFSAKKIIGFDCFFISFLDKFNEVYYFKTNDVTEIKIENENK